MDNTSQMEERGTQQHEGTGDECDAEITWVVIWVCDVASSSPVWLPEAHEENETSKSDQWPEMSHKASFLKSFRDEKESEKHVAHSQSSGEVERTCF